MSCIVAEVEQVIETPPNEAQTREVPWPALEAAEQKNDRATFNRLFKTINWRERNAEELHRAIRLCISLEMVRFARELADLGMQLYPEDKMLARIAYVIAPPRVIGTRPAKNLDLPASRKWLNENSSNFKGQWIAVREGKLLGASPVFEALLEQIGQENRTPATIVARVSS
jgi:hypothetical protein